MEQVNGMLNKTNVLKLLELDEMTLLTDDLTRSFCVVLKISVDLTNKSELCVFLCVCGSHVFL